MNATIFSEALGEIDSRYLEEYLSFRPGCKKRSVKKWTALAACLCLAAVLATALPLLQKNADSSGFGTPSSDPLASSSDDEPSGETMGDATGAPQVVINGHHYMISSHLAVSRECPEGFTLGGIIESWESASCEYYVNPEIPEWVYVYQEVNIGEELDETGSVPIVEPHMAYLRYVDAAIRGKHLVSYQGQLYLSMWSAAYDNTLDEVYEQILEQYGVRIEGDPLDGFSLAGTAEFSGLDTIPTGELSSNTDSELIYANPDVPQILLVSTSWHTATAEEQGETLHTGFNIYIRYDLPEGVFHQ